MAGRNVRRPDRRLLVVGALVLAAVPAARAGPPASAVVELAAGVKPYTIAAGPDGALWFTDPTPNKIGRITTSGHVTLFPVPTAAANAYFIAAGPDGNLWFTE